MVAANAAMLGAWAVRLALPEGIYCSSAVDCLSFGCVVAANAAMQWLFLDRLCLDPCLGVWVQWLLLDRMCGCSLTGCALTGCVGAP